MPRSRSFDPPGAHPPAEGSGAPSAGAETSPESAGPPALRRLLLDAARDLLREPDTPLELRKVAERAGKSRTAPYLVFGKEKDGGGVTALRLAVAADGARELSRRMEEAASSTGDPLVAFERVARSLLEFVEANPRLFRLMYGPATRALVGAGGESLRDHPEFRGFLEGRERAAAVIDGLMREARRSGLLQSAPGSGGEDPSSTAMSRAVGTAWATLIGAAVVREDQLFPSAGRPVPSGEAARQVTEAVFGVDPGLVEEVWRLLREVPGAVRPPALAQSPSTTAPPGGRPAPPPSTSRPRSPGAGAASEAPERTRGSDWLPGLLKDLVPLKDPTAAAREILKRLEVPGQEEAGAEAAPAEDADEGDASLPGPEAPPAEAPEARRTVPRDRGPSPTAILRSHSGLRRAILEARRLRGTPVLWVDAHPEEHEAEAEALRVLGLHLVRARDVEEAFRRIDRQNSSELGPFRAILSDLSRGSRWRPGTETVSRLSRTAPDTPIIVYVSEEDRTLGVPRGAAGITDSPDELLHLLLDAVGRGPAPAGRQRDE